MRRKGLEIYEFFFGASFVQDRSDSWRLMTQTNSLVAKVLKANYYPRSNFLNVVLRQGASYTWQSIWSAKMVLSEGIDWRFHQYQVVGKALPTENDEHPKIYRMKLWVINEVRAKSKFWYFLRKLKKVKKSNGQVLAINEMGILCFYASKALELHQTVNAVVEIVKEHYLVIAIPEYNHAIGYASIAYYNTQKLPQKQFVNGQRVIATVMALSSPETSGRLLLHLNSIGEVTETSSSKRAKKKSSYNVGSLVPAEVTEIMPLKLRLKFGIGFCGRVHITEVNDNNVLEKPFGNFKVGQTITARIVGIWDLSIKPAMLAA
ncbi:hypothetical protein ES319_D08G100800v1 [Gossypium barbadense]|uniref:S1 motif domain-containing protein n=2 Tax=Gossypium barbadense TaxID=3634 RepID=A0A5J5QBR0_GOSBA|nr:hypothetical protein ES319_D08G100800v1 [Gossypium barbadense]